ncbi:FAD dependent sulfhydryl oxidase [Protomyces lactucae-debilis]|uniref:Sulfhydryl oxidase n=1 Tax=Protomyces lactucae-debilis TaxID=2754530 RepID=A0A1Y2F9C1_PROLT|nr:FAD dependent sulfhydryl oxidase [Protomyces lactucae-debilis]ORY79495.1 FAD dependent sulfhydryl oxidase [Protomyces lactucae-debilis]
MSGLPLKEGYYKKDGIVYGPDGKPCRQCNSLRDLMSLGKKPQGSSGTDPNPFSFGKRPRADPPAEGAAGTSNRGTVGAAAGGLAAASQKAGMSSDKPAIDTENCPPDVELLGRSTWTLLHTMAANYPNKATPVQQTDMSAFLRTFSNFYPCWVCAEDFRTWMAQKDNEPVLNQGWKGLGQWMCRAHNEVNEKLGKEKFDCKLWQERWKDGFKDGRCDP